MADSGDRWQRRYVRERKARFEAESIAERAIADLQDANSILDHRVAERTSELETALARLTEADSIKSTFVRGLAHAMSTPLHAVNGMVEFIESETDDEAIRDSARQASEAAQRLNRALRTLLEFAAISHGEMSTTAQVLSIGEYADSVSSRWQLAAARAGLLLVVEVRPDPQTRIVADEARLDQIVDALLDNAVKFGHGEILVKLTWVAEPESHLQIEVSDLGPGVPDELGDQIFEAFVRDTNTPQGFGVGLTLGRAVAEALGGSLEMAETPVGARFVAIVPLA